MLAKGLFCLTLLVGYAACAYPNSPQITKDYRQITIKYNASEQPANTLGYTFDIMLANKPSYFVSSTRVVFTPDPNVTIKDLLIDDTIKYRVVYNINGTNPTTNDYSPFYNVKVKESNLAKVSIVPGKPLNLKIEKNPASESTHSVIVSWNDPTNVQNAVEKNDKDIQYQLEICPYNRYTPLIRTGCMTYAKMLKNISTHSQSTQIGLVAQFYQFNFHPDKENELFYILTPVTLNGTKGEPATTFKRIDDTKTPPTPSNVNASDIFAHQLTLSWDHGVSDAKAYVEIETNTTKEVREATSNPFVITGLENGTDYGFKVGIYTTKYGGSAFSEQYNLTTTNELKPKPTQPPSSSNMLTSSIMTMIASVFIVFKLC